MNFVKGCYNGVCNSLRIAKYGKIGTKIKIQSRDVDPVIKSLYPGTDVIFYGQVNEDNVPHGIGELYLNDRKTKIFEGEFEKGLVLRGKFINRNGDVFKVDFKDGKPWTGKAKVVSKNGDIFEGEFRYGQRFKGKLVKINGQEYEGEFRDDKPFRGKFVSPAGEFEGEFTENGDYWTGTAKIRNLMWGNKRFEHTWGDKFEVVEYKDGEEVIKKNGYEFVGFSGELKDGEPWTGTAKVLSENGDIFEGKIKDGQRFRGKLVTRDGEFFEGEFKDNKPFRGKLLSPEGDKFEVKDGDTVRKI